MRQLQLPSAKNAGDDRLTGTVAATKQILAVTVYQQHRDMLLTDQFKVRRNESSRHGIL